MDVYCHFLEDTKSGGPDALAASYGAAGNAASQAQLAALVAAVSSRKRCSGWPKGRPGGVTEHAAVLETNEPPH